MSLKLINPGALGAPSGYSNGVLTEAGGKLLFIAGQIAWDQNQTIVSDDFVELLDEVVADDLLVLIPCDLSGDKEQFAAAVYEQAIRVTARRTESLRVD